MVRRFRLLVSLFLAILSPEALAAGADSALVRPAFAEIHKTPSAGGKTMVRLAQGREVSVLETSADGAWTKVRAQLPHGDDTITFEGWIGSRDLTLPKQPEADHTAADAEWSDASKADRPAAAEPAAQSATPAPAATPEQTPAPGSGAEWFDETEASTTPALPAPAAQGDNTWDNSPAAATPTPTSTPAKKTKAKTKSKKQ